MRLRKKVMAVLLSAAMIATTVCIPEKNVQTVSASSFNNLNQTEKAGILGTSLKHPQTEPQMRQPMAIQRLTRNLSLR